MTVPFTNGVSAERGTETPLAPASLNDISDIGLLHKAIARSNADKLISCFDNNLLGVAIKV